MTNSEKITVFIIFLFVVFLFSLWVRRDIHRWFRRRKRSNRNSAAQRLDAEPRWDELFAKAERTVRNTIAAFPEELKVKAQQLPCLLEKWPHTPPSDAALGRYLGFEPGYSSEYNGPIILYVGAIHDYCLENGRDFEEEVRTTYLHEFGHHLGWDEEDLEERGLG